LAVESGWGVLRPWQLEFAFQPNRDPCPFHPPSAGGARRSDVISPMPTKWSIKAKDWQNRFIGSYRPLLPYGWCNNFIFSERGVAHLCFAILGILGWRCTNRVNGIAQLVQNSVNAWVK
jgi:hypothetical protein